MRRVVGWLALLLAAGSAGAQDMGWSTITPSVTGTDTLGLVLREQMGGPSAAPETPPAAAAPAEAAPVAADALRYTPSRERRAANYAAFVAKARTTDPKGADDLARTLAANDLVEMMREPLSKYGLRIDDVGDAYTAWWVNAWQASRGRNDDVSAATAAAVRGQVAKAMGATKLVAAASDANKQELAESLLLHATFLAAGMEQAQGKPEQLQAVAAAATQGARGMGLDLTKMELTEKGFVPAG